jgi:hypothetical protein
LSNLLLQLERVVWLSSWSSNPVFHVSVDLSEISSQQIVKSYDWSPKSRLSMVSSSSLIFFSYIFHFCEADRRVYLTGRAYRWFWHCDCHSFACRQILFHRIWKANQTQRSDTKV